MTQPRGLDWFAIQRALRAWVSGGTLLPLDHVYWGGQDMPRIVEPAVELNAYAYAPVTEPWLDREVNLLVVQTFVVTNVDTLMSTLTVPNHGLVTGDGPVTLATTGTIPGGLKVGDVWVVVVDGSTLRLCDDYRRTGGNFPGNPITALTITSPGSGTLTLSGNARTRRAGHEINYVARSNGRLTLDLDCHTTAAVGPEMAMSVLQGVAARRPLPSQQAILRAANIGVQQVERVRWIRGVRNAVMFEPRARLQVHLSTPSEVFEPGTIIRYLTGTNQITGQPFLAP